MPIQLPILAFHSLEDSSSNLAFPPDLFAKGMASLKGIGFRTLTVSQAASLLKTGTPWPERTFVITFDDGYRSVHKHAFPVLAQLGFTATVYINSGPVQGPELPDMLGRPRLSWEQLREASRNGFEIGAHTVSHPDLTLLGPDQIESELTVNKQILEQFLGISVPSFAYPFGFVSPQARALVARHFESACSGNLEIATSASDPFALPRLEMHYFRTSTKFNLLTSDWLPTYLALRRTPRAFRQRIRRVLQSESDTSPSW
jgi:peptidoglycan/xylan/chitin deacetylase (PgdA/CDA1 family)